MPQRSYPHLVRMKNASSVFHTAFWVKIVVLSVGWLLLGLLKSASCPFCNSRKNSFCFYSFFKILSSFLSEVVIVFPCFLRFFLRFFLKLKEFFLIFCFFFFFGGGSFLEFFSVNIPRNQNNYSVCVCVCARTRACFLFFFVLFFGGFCVQHKTVSAELNFSLWSGGEGRKIWKSLFDYVTILLTDSFFKYSLSDTLCRLYNLIPCSCLTKILFGLLYAGTLM